MINSDHIIIYYKGDISALTLFCQQPDGGICYPPLPALTSFIEEEMQQIKSIDLNIASALIKNLNAEWQLDDDLLVAESTFFQQVEKSNGIATIYLVRLKVLDPPHELIESKQAKLQTITALRGISQTELELLRRAYSNLMEG